MLDLDDTSWRYAMNSNGPRNVVTKIVEGLVFVVGGLVVALTVWLWGKRHYDQQDKDKLRWVDSPPRREER